MEEEDLALAGVKLFRPRVFEDNRGHFSELFKASVFAKLLPGTTFVQDNLSFSKKGTLRGLHFQAPPYAQGKLVCVPKGRVLDVVVDLRRSSTTFGKHLSVELASEPLTMLFVPEGFAHGFFALEDSFFLYKCTNEYAKESEGGLRYDDPELTIVWPNEPAVVSAKDHELPFLHELESPFS